MPLHTNTPLLHSRALSSCLGGSVQVSYNAQLNAVPRSCIVTDCSQVWAKMDALQPSGSFKLRGIGHMTSQLAQQGATRFVSSSGGNAGIAVACVRLCRAGNIASNGLILHAAIVEASLGCL